MPPLGWIKPVDRTKVQHQAHAAAMPHMVKYTLPLPKLAKGDKVCLYNAWPHPKVVADVGFTFDRIHQITGSCVWAGGTNALFSTIATQRLLPTNPTKAFLPFTLHNYAMSRHAIGDDGEGSGSLGSTFAKSLTVDGVRDWLKGGGDGLPVYTDEDGVSVSERVELTWSSYRNPALQTVLAAAKPHLLGAAGECKTVRDIRAMNLNGFGISFACNNYIGNASIKGSGADAYVTGRWDGSGGHQQSILGVWEHPTDGPLYWAQNNWAGSTYPKDPAGGPICGCWVTEANVEAALRLDSEVYGLSAQSWFPAQPDVPVVLSWLI